MPRKKIKEEVIEQRFTLVGYIDSSDDLTLVDTDKPLIPDMIFGDVIAQSDRVIQSFNDRENNTGVLFSGLKGNSKTLSSNLICLRSGLPIFIITEFIPQTTLTNFILNLPMECIIFIDEFEKKFHTKEMQETLLSLMDGSVNAKKLFIFTTNSTEISQFLLNRPSRLFYHYKFNNLSDVLINEIIDYKLKSKKYEDGLRDIITTMCSVSFDVLSCLIEEMNRFDNPPHELIRDMNIQVEQKQFECTIFKDGKMSVTKVNFNPFIEDTFFISYKNDKGYHDFISAKKADFIMYKRNGTFVFESEPLKLIFKPIKTLPHGQFEIETM